MTEIGPARRTNNMSEIFGIILVCILIFLIVFAIHYWYITLVLAVIVVICFINKDNAVREARKQMIREGQFVKGLPAPYIEEIEYALAAKGYSKWAVIQKDNWVYDGISTESYALCCTASSGYYVEERVSPTPDGEGELFSHRDEINGHSPDEIGALILRYAKEIGAAKTKRIVTKKEVFRNGEFHIEEKITWE